MRLLGIVAFAATAAFSHSATASSLPGLTDNYEGSYIIENAFTPENHGNYLHGLWLPGFIGGNSWSVDTGVATYSDNKLDMAGTVSKTVDGTFYSLDFDFTVHETNNAPSGLICGGGNGPGTCKSQQDPGQGGDYIVFFDMGIGSIMGTVTGTSGNILDGLVMDIEMVPLSGDNRKPGQMGYGGNWYTDEFGYSNWMQWDVVTDSNALVQYGSSGSGDVNFTFVATPVPAGLPLILTGLAGFYALRRRQKAA